ncbi:effector-associated constant component EACC1 [Sphaerisporangium perillae]|uniref:effector-associated constant component EACC1 n=1 Tax=Sphaerisporangium perillae TaxID=2935860 RepID=UPI00200EC044|nr:hypothetical protein [Sphaerisporangium perillae]
MAVWLSIESENASDTLRDLYGWLSEEPESRGRVKLREREPEPGALGPVVEVLQLALGSGVFASTATVLVTWLRTRRGTVSLKLSREGQASLEVTATGVKNLDAAATKALTEHIAQVLNDAGASDETG